MRVELSATEIFLGKNKISGTADKKAPREKKERKSQRKTLRGKKHI